MSDLSLRGVTPLVTPEGSVSSPCSATLTAMSSAPDARAAVAGPQTAVRVDAVSAGYGGSPVLRSVTLDVIEGEVVSLLGPSGCGKTTLLRVMSGLHRADEGEVFVSGRLVDGSTGFVSPEQRSVGMVFQDGALFPHLSVLDNVRFGLRGRADAEARALEVLRLVDMADYANRLPGTLSGGQQQRIALARALAPEPSVLLLDEPFSALDAGLRVQLRRDVKRILSDVGITVVVVTHDQEEAFVLGDRVAVMRNGTIEQVGSPAELYECPVSPWVASFVGEANLLVGQRSEGHVNTSVGALPLRAPVPGSGAIEVLVRPEELSVVAGDHAVVEAVEYFGHDARFDVRTDDGEHFAVRMALAPFAVGDRVDVRFVGSSVSGYELNPG